MRKFIWMLVVCAVPILAASLALAENGPPSGVGPPTDLVIMILDRLIAVFEQVISQVPEFLQPLFEAIIEFLQALFGVLP